MRSCVKYAESCAVRARLQCCSWSAATGLSPPPTLFFCACFSYFSNGVCSRVGISRCCGLLSSFSACSYHRPSCRTVARAVAHETDSDSLRPPDRCECSSIMAARARPVLLFIRVSTDSLVLERNMRCRAHYSTNDPTAIEGKGVSGVSMSSRHSSFSFSASTGR